MATLRTIRSKDQGRVRRTGAVAASVALLSAGLTLSAAPAGADVGDLVCTATAALNFSPALTPGGRSAVDAAATLANCTSANGGFTQLTSGTITSTATASASFGALECPLLFTIEGTGAIAWNDGSTSDFDYTINSDPGTGLVTISAQVTGGPMTGDTVSAVPVVPTLNTDCPTAGLTALGITAAANFA